MEFVQFDCKTAKTGAILMYWLDDHELPYTMSLVHVTVQNPNLFKESIVLCEQIQVIDKSKLVKPICRLTDDEMAEVNKALAVSVGDYELPDKR